VDWTEAVTATQLPPSDPQNIIVYWGLNYIGGDDYVCRHSPTALDVYLLECPIPESKGAAAGKPKSENPRATNRDINEILERAYSRQKLTCPDRHEAEIDGEGNGFDDVDFDEETAKYDWETELAEARARLHDTTDIETHDFKVVVRGGASLADTGGRGLCCTAQAVGRHVETWCRDRAIPFSSRYEIARFTLPHAQTFARAWAQKMQFFYNKASESVNPLRAFTNEELDSWVVPSEFSLCVDAIADRHCKKRAQDLLNLFR
jgi:hypothetical protein